MCVDEIKRVCRVRWVMTTSWLRITTPKHLTLHFSRRAFILVKSTRMISRVELHNHPSGDPKPSAQDVAITREIVAAAAAVSVKVHDHLVIGRKGAESFKSLGLL